MAVTTDGTPYVEPGDAISAYPVVSQELAAVIDSLRTMIPVGSIFPYAGKTAPEGWLMCDGKAYTRTDFYDLYVIMADWVGQWGGFPNGNSQQFFVPDFRGRSPMGTNPGGNDETWGASSSPTSHSADLGERAGDWRVHNHDHRVTGTAWAGVRMALGTEVAASALQPGSGMQTVQYGLNASEVVYARTDPRDAGYGLWPGLPLEGQGQNLPPVTAVNFIVWTGTTTAGKSPVPGTELAPVTTRQMIEARLEQAGIGDEEIEMLRAQLAALKEDTNG